MSAERRRGTQAGRREKAAIFAALGDETRLLLLARISRAGQRYSIADLTQGSTLTRQAITKHLRVLQEAKIVRGVREGRANRFEFVPEQLAQARRYIDEVSGHWEEALGRLKTFVEK